MKKKLNTLLAGIDRSLRIAFCSSDFEGPLSSPIVEINAINYNTYLQNM